MKRIAINGRFTAVLQKTGTHVVSRELVDHLVRAKRDAELVLLIDPGYEDADRWASADGVQVVGVPFRDWGRTRSQLFEQLAMVGLARRHGAALLHHPMNTCPRNPRSMPQVVTLHDLNFHHHPEWYGRTFRTWLEWTMMPGLRRADVVACISRYVADDLHRTVGVRRERIVTIYNGLRPLPALVPVDRVDPPVVLAVNPWQPHKNLPRLIRAVGAVREQLPGVRLHVVGRVQANFRHQPDLEALLHEPYVEVLGYLEDEALAQAYASASVLCLPSLEEGFGMPVIEAMHFGTPIVTSNASCLPEIVGDAGILVEPTDESAIADGLLRALTEAEPDRRARVARARARLPMFSWERAASEYLAVYDRVLQTRADA